MIRGDVLLILRILLFVDVFPVRNKLCWLIVRPLRKSTPLCGGW